MKIKRHPFLLHSAIALTAVFLGCQEDLNIAEFADEYGEYQSELRIEAILDVVDPMSSVVRVDRSIVVTDTTIFNGRDDDGDWDVRYDDVGEDGMKADDEFLEPDEGEDNGLPDPGEPHVDELDEILPQIHDSTLTVVLKDLTTGRTYDFTWHTLADSFTVTTDVQEDLVEVNGEGQLIEMITYGAYKPVAFDDSVAFNHEYEFVLTDNGRRISARVYPLPPAVFELEDHILVDDTLQIVAGGLQWFDWTTVPEATVHWVLVEEILGPDTVETVTSHPSAPVDQREDGTWVSRDILSLYFPGLYRWTISVPSRAYGAYVYSQLPLRDEQVSNFRDQDGNVVLGIAGSAAATTQYVRILPL
ncbi:MAG: hypothetical protein JSU77_08885 [Fidelibacterota bacterium]|nr:MAG: hypothetical protein JSU77_08885 [Candidatus Neomarinimicrobiota bacterium]